MDEVHEPKLGQIVRIKRGRDRGRYAIIIRKEDDRYVWIADGDKRKFDQPKKKNIIHLQLLNEWSQEVIDSLMESGRVSNSKLRFVLNRFVERLQTDTQEKGE